MKKFFKKIAFFLLSVIAFLIVDEVFINNRLNNNELYKIDRSIDVLILGNSHPECSLNDSLINHSINFSQSAECYFYTYYKLKKLVEANPHIKTVILEYTNTVFRKEMDNWLFGEQYLGSKYPKYSQLISIKDNSLLFYKNPGPYLIAYKDALKAKGSFLLRRNKCVYNELDWGGYSYLVRDKIQQIKNDIQKSNIQKLNPDEKLTSTLNISNLKKIADLCKANNLKLILFRSPLHPLYVKDFETELTNLLKSDLHDIPFWDYSNYQLDDFEFADLEHLNHFGAKRFSKVINLRLEQEGLL